MPNLKILTASTSWSPKAYPVLYLIHVCGGGYLKERDNWKDLGVNGKAWSGLMWLSTETNGRM
jgi:hypothetical protein